MVKHELENLKEEKGRREKKREEEEEEERELACQPASMVLRSSPKEPEMTHI